MSSPMAESGSVSPTESTSTISTLAASTSSRDFARTLVYTRNELLALATSPLSQAPAPAAIVAFPQILRKTRRGVLQAYQALDHARSSGGATVPVQDRSSKPNVVHLNQSSSPRALPTSSPSRLPPPMWKVNVYVPPARRAEQEHRVRPGRDLRSSRTWRRPTQARGVHTQSQW